MFKVIIRGKAEGKYYGEVFFDDGSHNTFTACKGMSKNQIIKKYTEINLKDKQLKQYNTNII